MNILKVLTPRRLLGNFGEKSACKFLKKSGYKILERNFIAFNKEIDIIAKNKREDVTVFVEVKTRSSTYSNPNEPRPASAVTPKKQRDIIKAAKCYIAFQRLEGRVRFDVIEVIADAKGKKKKISYIKHLENAFNYNSANKGVRK